jgi:Protein of unknown function (DUF4242)
MAEFLVELYASRTDPAVTEGRPVRARLAAEELTREEIPVRYLRSIFVPEDETCFYLYEADSAEAVRQAVGRAALRFERVSEAITDSNGVQT